MGLRNGILIRIRKKHIRIGNKFDCVEGVRDQKFQGKKKISAGDVVCWYKI